MPLLNRVFLGEIRLACCPAMTHNEKSEFVRGFKGFFIRPVPEHGIPFVYMRGASQGIHIRLNLDETMIKQPDRWVAA